MSTYDNKLLNENNSSFFRFDDDFITDKVINDNWDEIRESICSSNFVPKVFRDNILVCNKLLSVGEYYLVAAYFNHLDYFNEKILSKYLDTFIDVFKINMRIPFGLINNKILFDELLRREEFSLLRKMDDSLFTDEVVDNNLDKFLKAIYNDNDFINNVKYNKNIFRRILEDGRNDLINYFSISVIDDELIEKYGFFNLVADPFLRHGYNRYSSSKRLFNFCLKYNSFSYIFSFDASLFTDEVISKYAHLIVREMNVFNFKDEFKSNKVLFLECIKQKRYEVSCFSRELLTEEVVSDNIALFINYVRLFSDIPEALKNSKVMFNTCIQEGIWKLLSEFSQELEINDENYNYIISLVNDKCNYELVRILKDNISLKKKLIVCEKWDIFLMMSFNCSILENEDVLNLYAKALNTNKEILRGKLEYLTSRNIHIFETFNISMLGKKYEGIGLNNIERFGLYEDIQSKILKFNDNEIRLFEMILNVLNTNEYDLTGVIKKIIYNMSLYRHLTDTIKWDKINEDVVKNIIYILEDDTNRYNINKFDDLLIFEEKKREYFAVIDRLVKSNVIGYSGLKSAIFLRKYGCDYEMIDFITSRYNLMELKQELNNNIKGSISYDVYKILEDIYSIDEENNIYNLEKIWDKYEEFNGNFYQLISLEAFIRSEYAKAYKETLYHPRREHLVNDEHYLKDNEKVYKIISNSNVDTYLLDGDFGMIVHCLGAFYGMEDTNNYKDSWERPEIFYHGICTSYIRNDQIMVAENKYPVYGFDNFENGALLLSSNCDLYSDAANEKYDTSSFNKSSNFYSPNTMIRLSRNTVVNEMVLERRNMSDGINFKRKPNYVVYFAYDIDNKIENVLDSKLFFESVRAAKEHGIPLVIVDVFKYKKREAIKCKELFSEFVRTREFKYLEEMLIRYCNNLAEYDSKKRRMVKIECDIFNERDLELWLKLAIQYMSDRDNKEVLYFKLSKLMESEEYLSDYLDLVPKYDIGYGYKVKKRKR